jgi:hypothetical protein
MIRSLREKEIERNGRVRPELVEVGQTATRIDIREGFKPFKGSDVSKKMTYRKKG